VDDPGVDLAAAGAEDCSGWTSFGADAQAEKVARVERKTIAVRLKIRALFKFVLLLLNFRLCGKRRNANSSYRFLHHPENPWVRVASSALSRLKTH
jgi:hypothetical protein